MNERHFLNVNDHYAIPWSTLLDQCEDEKKQLGVMLFCMSACGYAVVDTGEWQQQGLN